LIQKSDLKAIAKNAVDESTKMVRQPMRAAYTDDATNGNYYIAIVPHFMEKGKLNFQYEFNNDVWEPVTKKLQLKVPSICSFLTYRQYKDKISSSKIEDMFEYYEDPEAEQIEGCEEDYANEVNDNDFILVPRRKPKMLPATNKTCSEGFRCTNGRTCNKEHTYEEKAFFDVSNPKQRYNYKTVFCLHLPTCRYVHKPHQCCFAHKKEEYFCRPCGLTGDHLVVDCPHND
jgi:hypothetical protein